MSDNISIIGGADGPTSVFVAGKLGMNWLSTFGLVLVILLLIPNIIYAVRVKNQKNKCNIVIPLSKKMPVGITANAICSR